MEEALEVTMRLLTGEAVTAKTDWFELKEARLHLTPYTRPHFPIVVASTFPPFGMMAAGKHGLGVLSIGAGLPEGPEALSKQWQIATDTTAQHGKTTCRSKWCIVVNMHVGEDDEAALAQVRRGERAETIDYFDRTLGRSAGRSDDPLRDGVKMGTTLVRSSELVARGIERLYELSAGGFGSVLFRAPEWANREDTMRSDELFANCVMLEFQDSLMALRPSNEWARENRKAIFAPSVEAVRQAFTDVGCEAPADLFDRALGGRDAKS